MLIIWLVVRGLEEGDLPVEWITTTVFEQFVATLLTRLSLNSSVRLSRSKLSECIRIDEDETGVTVHIGRCRVFRIEIPMQRTAVMRDTLLKCLKGTNDIWRRAATRTAASDECAVESVPAKVLLIATAVTRRVLPGR